MSPHTPELWTKSDFDRAVDCVNACGNVENPALLIEQATECVQLGTQLMEENAALKTMLTNICKAFGDLQNRPTFKSLNHNERNSIKLAREFLNHTNNP
jgi:hypothetical protein